MLSRGLQSASITPHRLDGGAPEQLLVLKGSPEEILDRCDLAGTGITPDRCTGQRMPWPGEASGCSSLRSGLLPAPLDLVGKDTDTVVIDAAVHSLQPAKACSCSVLRVSRTRHVLRRYLCGSGPQGLAVDGSGIPCVDWHAHNAPLVGAGAGGAPFCLSEVVMTVFAVLFRLSGGGCCGPGPGWCLAVKTPVPAVWCHRGVRRGW